MTTDTPTVAERLAEHIASLDYSNLPPAVIDRTKMPCWTSWAASLSVQLWVIVAFFTISSMVSRANRKPRSSTAT